MPPPASLAFLTVRIEQPPYSLSVVLATAHPGQPLDDLLSVLLPQLAAVGGELVFIDGTEQGLPTPAHEGAAVLHIHEPGGDVFEMRATGVERATGWVVAFSEDHCMPSDEHWCERILDAHRLHGDRAAVSGSVSNGTTATLWDRASFLLTFGTVVPPIPEPRSPRTPPPANVSIKREVLDDHRAQFSSGFVEFELLPHLTRSGHMAYAPEINATHYQAHSWRWFLAHHFHNGRTTSSLLPRARGVSMMVRRVLDSFKLVVAHTQEALREQRKRPETPHRDRAAVAFLALLVASHATGQLVGLAAGPGASPRALE